MTTEPQGGKLAVEGKRFVEQVQARREYRWSSWWVDAGLEKSLSWLVSA